MAISSLKFAAKAVGARIRIDELSVQHNWCGAGIRRKTINLDPADIEKIKAYLSHIGEREERQNMVIEKCR